MKFVVNVVLFCINVVYVVNSAARWWFDKTENVER